MKVLQELELERAEPVLTPSTLERYQEEEISENNVTRFRGVSARSKYLAADMPDCKFSAEEISRFIAKPAKLSVEGVKGLGCYLCGQTILVYCVPLAS